MSAWWQYSRILLFSKSQTIQKLPVMSPPIETEGCLAQRRRHLEFALELDAISLSVATSQIRQPAVWGEGQMASLIQSTVGTRQSPGVRERLGSSR